MRSYIGEIVIGILIAVYILITQVQIWNLQDRLDLTQKVLEWKGICNEYDFEIEENLAFED
jgi:cell division protein FtsL